MISHIKFTCSFIIPIYSITQAYIFVIDPFSMSFRWYTGQTITIFALIDPITAFYPWVVLQDFIEIISNTYSTHRLSDTSISISLSIRYGTSNGFDAILFSIPLIYANVAMCPIVFLFPISHSYTLNPSTWSASEGLINWPPMQI